MPETRAPGDLIPYARNARTHPEAQIDQIIASIQEFGFTNPILVNRANTVIAGHGRLAAALRMGLAQVPVLVLGDLTPAQEQAYILADNKLALNAGWDEDMLRLELLALQEEGFDTAILGFGEEELARILRPGATDPDEVPPVEADAVTREGDVWLCGDHRIACGDATAPATVQAVLAGETPHLMVTDPPYGVEYEPGWRKVLHRTGMAQGKVLNDDRADWREAWDLFPGDVAYVWCAPGTLSCVVHASLEAAGLHARMQIIWAKSQGVISRGHYHPQHEAVWYAVRKGKTAHWHGDRAQTTLWRIDKPHKSETGHSTQKPVECMRRPIENNSAPGDAVYEPFSGSGTTMIAAEMMARRCLAIELHPQYVDVAVRRWQAFTERAATRQGDGRTFAEVADG